MRFGGDLPRTKHFANVPSSRGAERTEIREKDEAEVELSTICRQLKLESSDGKKYETDCADTEGIFRIVQSIP